MSGTIRKKCTCESAFQDSRCGPGVRVHNIMRKDGKRPDGARCTVCLSVKEYKGE